MDTHKTEKELGKVVTSFIPNPNGVQGMRATHVRGREDLELESSATREARDAETRGQVG